MNNKKKFLNKSKIILEDVTDETTNATISDVVQISDNDSADEEVVPMVEKKVTVEAEEDVTSYLASKNTSSNNESKTVKSSFTAVLYDVMATVIGAFVIISIVFVLLFRVVGVDGESMTNTLQHGDWLLAVNKVQYEQGDIVVVTQDTYFHTPLIKRVIAVGGQTIDIDYETATVYIDGKAIEEPYVREDFIFPKADDCSFPYTVPDGMLFCMGDNRNGSTDSRSSLVGPIDERQILGKAVVRLFPLGEFNIYDYKTE